MVVPVDGPAEDPANDNPVENRKEGKPGVRAVELPHLGHVDCASRLSGLSDALDGRITFVAAGQNDSASGQRAAASSVRAAGCRAPSSG